MTPLKKAIIARDLPATTAALAAMSPSDPEPTTEDEFDLPVVVGGDG